MQSISESNMRKHQIVSAVLQFYSSVVLYTLTSLQELVQDKIRKTVAKIDEKSIAVFHKADS